MNVKLINDVDQIKKYYDLVIPELTKDEVLFISLSARNKYLTPEERKIYGMSRTEMFAKTVIRKRDFEYFIRKIRKLECQEGAYITKQNMPIPQKTIVVYMNINTCGMIKAYNKFKFDVERQLEEFILGLSNNHDAAYAYLRKMDSKFLSVIQNTPGTRIWIDVDFDFPNKDNVMKNESYVKLFCKELKDNKVEYIVIQTKSGFHILLKRSTIKYNFHTTITMINSVVDEEFKNSDKFEIVLNKNDMVPLPGTLQAGFPVMIREDL